MRARTLCMCAVVVVLLAACGEDRPSEKATTPTPRDLRASCVEEAGGGELRRQPLANKATLIAAAEAYRRALRACFMRHG